MNKCYYSDESKTEDMTVKFVSPQEQLKKGIIKRVPSPKEWATMKQVTKLKFKISGMGLNKIAAIFGLDGNPVCSHSMHLQLGQLIYGNKSEYLYPREELSPDELRQEILKKIPTPEAWVEKTITERINLRINSYSLYRIGKVFGIKGDARCKNEDYLKLGQIIYGYEYKCLNYHTPKELKEIIIKRIPNCETWKKMTSNARTKFKIGQLGIRSIASKFGVEYKPKFDFEHHLELGRKIYGNRHSCLYAFSKKNLKIVIKKLIPKHKKWQEMTQVEKRKFKTLDLGLVAIASKFDVRGDPIRNHKFHLELGKKIYT